MRLPKSFTTVTPFTRMLALSMLIIFPICGFFLGIYYQQIQYMNKPEKVVVEYKMLRPTYPPNSFVTSAQIQTCKTNSDCPSGDFCTRSGPIIYNPKTNELPPMTCHKKGTVVAF
jgi:hypothetical protein